VPIVDETSQHRRHRRRCAMMSGNDTSATTTLTSTDVAVVSASTPANEQENSPTLTPDCNESANMDLANGPNPWLPAYGFQLQHHSQFQPTHLEDLRANGLYTVYLFPLSSCSFSFFFFLVFFFTRTRALSWR